MKKKKFLGKKKSNFLYWAPRIFGIMFVFFISLFALDVFGEFSGFDIVIALFMHLIPSFVLTGILIVSWRHERLGGILYLILAIVFTLFFKTYEDVIVFLLITGPVLLVGILFLINYYRGGGKR